MYLEPAQYEKVHLDKVKIAKRDVYWLPYSRSFQEEGEGGGWPRKIVNVYFCK